MKNNFVVASMVLIILTAISKITGFLREMVLAYFYGASAMTDAFITATTVATLLIGGITSATALAYIPRATEARVKNQNVTYITSNLITVCGLLILFISIMAMFFSRELTWLFAMGFDEHTLTLAATMTFIILPFCSIYAMYNIAVGYLQSINSFWFIGASAILANIIIITGITVSNNNPQLLALGFAGSWTVPAIWALYLTRKKGMRYSFVFNLKDNILKAIAVSSIPIFIGQLVIQFNTLVDRNFASTLGEGIISAMQYANKLNLLFITLFVVSIATTLFPRFSEQVASGNIGDLKKTASKSINVILLLVMPVVTGVIILAQPIVELVYMRGQFDQSAAIVTGNVLALYALGMPGLSFAEILNREFYALQDTKTPVLCSVVSIFTNIILNLILIQRFGYLGLAAATSIAATILAGLLFILLRRKIGAIGIGHLTINFTKLLFAVVIMAFVVFHLNSWLVSVLGTGIGNRIITLMVNVLVGAVIYFCLGYLLKVKEVLEIWQIINSKVTKSIQESSRIQ